MNPTFDQIYKWAVRKAKRQHDPITVVDAAKRFRVTTYDIRVIMEEANHPYLYIVGHFFEFDGE